MRVERAIFGVILAAVLGPYGCGGGSSSSSGGGVSGGGITWPSRDGGMSPQLPPAVDTGRVVFESASGESCCVAVDPSLISGGSQRGLAILTDLPVGPATVTVAGFSVPFAPVVPGILAICSTVPGSGAQPCDPVRVAAPAFESPPLVVNIVGGTQTNIPAVPMDALPFLYDFSPAQDASAPAPVQFALTVVDAVTDIRSDSVALEVNFNLPDESRPPPAFRAVTKRVTLNLNACSDGSTAPCSQGGNLQLDGFKATGTAPELPEGEVEAHITAQNLADPPRDLDFRYPFNVLATATETATAMPTANLTAAADAAAGATPAAPSREGAPSVPETGGGGPDGRDGTVPSKAARPGAPAIRATPTVTPTPGSRA